MTIFRSELSEYLTGEKKTFVQSHPGMAHFAGSGPEGATCLGCKYFGSSSPPDATKRTFDYHSRGGKHGGLIKPQTRQKYKALMRGVSGHKVPDSAKACKYYEASANPPKRYDRGQ